MNEKISNGLKFAAVCLLLPCALLGGTYGLASVLTEPEEAADEVELAAANSSEAAEETAVAAATEEASEDASVAEETEEEAAATVFTVASGSSSASTSTAAATASSSSSSKKAAKTKTAATKAQVSEVAEEETVEVELGETTLLADGTYVGWALCGEGASGWSKYYVFVEIEVVGGVVAAITSIYGDAAGTIDAAVVYNATENSLYLNKAINGYGRSTLGLLAKINALLAEGITDTSGLDCISGATYSSDAIFEAFEMALALALETGE